MQLLTRLETPHVLFALSVADGITLNEKHAIVGRIIEFLEAVKVDLELDFPSDELPPVAAVDPVGEDAADPSTRV